jgi:hypothetical protein
VKLKTSERREQGVKSLVLFLSIYVFFCALETLAASVQRDATGCVTTEPGYESSF